MKKTLMKFAGIILCSLAFVSCSSDDGDDDGGDAFYNVVIVDGIYYNLTKSTSKTAEVTNSNGGDIGGGGGIYSGKVVIPTTIEYYGETYSVTAIGKNAFHYCSGLTSVDIPSSVKKIGDAAFYCCIGLNSVEIPSSVTTIGDNTFGVCSKLLTVYSFSTTPPNGYEETFSSTTYSNGTLYVPTGCKDVYDSISPWSLFENIVELE